MARSFTSDQLKLITGGRIKARLLAQFAMDEGSTYFCDDVYDMSDGTQTYIGASAIASCTDIQSSSNFSSEGITLTVDGNRLSQSGFTDPGVLFRVIMGEMVHQRRVYLSLGLSYPESQLITLTVPIFTGFINNCKVVNEQFDMISSQSGSTDPSDVQPTHASLVITLESLASRYNNATYRTRSHNDQLDIDISDNFFSFVNSVIQNEQVLYWGKSPPHTVGNQGTTYTGVPGFFQKGFQALGVPFNYEP